MVGGFDITSVNVIFKGGKCSMANDGSMEYALCLAVTNGNDGAPLFGSSCSLVAIIVAGIRNNWAMYIRCAYYVDRSWVTTSAAAWDYA